MFRIESIHHQAITQNKQQVQCNDTLKCNIFVVSFLKILLSNVVHNLSFSKSRLLDICFLSALRHYFFLIVLTIYLIVVFSKYMSSPYNFCS